MLRRFIPLLLAVLLQALVSTRLEAGADDDFIAIYKVLLAKTHMDKVKEAGIAGNMICSCTAVRISSRPIPGACCVETTTRSTATGRPFV